MDDVLSALDVHTARSVVNDCLAGSLLRGRTVILVTHNVAMAGVHVKNFVHVASDGSISSSDTFSSATNEDPDLLTELEEEAEAVDNADEIIDGSNVPDAVKTEGQKPSGKLIVAEEINLGRVTTKASE